MKSTIIIAEAGVNHNGDIDLAKKLIDAAADAQVDYVKFQTFIADENISKNAKKAEYQIENTKDAEETQLEMVKKLELSEADHLELMEYCNKKGVKFSSTAFDFKSIELLKKLQMDFIKIPSGEITNLPYLEKVASLNLPIVMSTGMANLQEVKEALTVLENNGVHKNRITVLHCNTMYPTPMEDVNLTAMLTIKKECKVKVGYSDHTLGIEVPIAAVALGAKIIEKHFTLDRNMAGPDHAASLEPYELISMVKGIRNIEKALGDGIKAPSPSEKPNIEVARKSIVAIKNIKKGETFTTENIGVKRPGKGISPMEWYKIIGKPARKEFREDELI